MHLERCRTKQNVVWELAKAIHLESLYIETSMITNETNQCINNDMEADNGHLAQMPIRVPVNVTDMFCNYR